MDKSRLQFEKGVWLDARRAIWFEELSVLAVADLHIGYNWAHRHGGQMLPLHQPDDTVSRLKSLCDFYKPAELLLLGDIVHRALPLPQIEAQLRELLAQFPGTRLRLIAGNHDRYLEKLISAPLQTEYICSRYLFVHGHEFGVRRLDAAFNFASDHALGIQSGVEPPHSKSLCPQRIIMGHEHPAISVGDGVTTSVTCPCFLVSPRVIVLPAFSLWAAGGGEMALRQRFDHAVAILGDKLLPIPLNNR